MKFAKHNQINQEIANTIFATIKNCFSTEEIPTEEIYKALSPPPKSGMGDIAFACFPLAKMLKQAPNQISTKLQEALVKNDLILEAKSFGPYLNFF